MVSGWVSASDLDALKPGASRADIEKSLGKPLLETEADGKVVATYQYDLGGVVEPLPPRDYGGGAVHPGLGALALILIPPQLTQAEMEARECYAAQRRLIEITYDKNGVVSDAEFRKPERGTDRLEYKIYVCKVQNRSDLQTKAAFGDAGAQYRLFKDLMLSRDQRLAWLCKSAHGGHSMAQARLGQGYCNAFFGLDLDRVQGYKWASLALGSAPDWQVKRQKAALDNMAARMTPDQLSEAKRMVSEWQPDPASCGAIVKVTSGDPADLEGVALDRPEHDTKLGELYRVCLSANLGDQSAQRWMSRNYEDGKRGLPADSIQALTLSGEFLRTSTKVHPSIFLIALKRE